MGRTKPILEDTNGVFYPKGQVSRYWHDWSSSAFLSILSIRGCLLGKERAMKGRMFD